DPAERALDEAGSRDAEPPTAPPSEANPPGEADPRDAGLPEAGLRDPDRADADRADAEPDARPHDVGLAEPEFPRDQQHESYLPDADLSGDQPRVAERSDPQPSDAR